MSRKGNPRGGKRKATTPFFDRLSLAEVLQAPFSVGDKLGPNEIAEPIGNGDIGRV
jgi:hypothetical protein